MPPAKRRKLSDEEEEKIRGSADESGLGGESESEADSSVHSSDGDESDDGSRATEDELEGLERKKSKKTSKRKIRATGASTFGATLQSLLTTNAPSSAPLSLKPSIARKHNDQKLELKAKRVLQIEKKEKEDKRRIKDPIGGWGGESERALRKVAQRGGTRCCSFSFNACPLRFSDSCKTLQCYPAIPSNRGSGRRGGQKRKGDW